MALPSSCCPAGFWGEVLVTVGAPCPAGTLLLDPVVRALPCFQSTFTFVSPRHHHSRCTVDVVPTADKDEDGSPQEEEAPPKASGAATGELQPLVVARLWLCGRAGRAGETERACDREQVGCDQSPGCSDTRVCPRERQPGCQGLSRELAEFPVERTEGKMEETGTGKGVKVQERKTVIADR